MLARELNLSESTYAGVQCTQNLLLHFIKVYPTIVLPCKNSLTTQGFFMCYSLFWKIEDWSTCCGSFFTLFDIPVLPVEEVLNSFQTIGQLISIWWWISYTRSRPHIEKFKLFTGWNNYPRLYTSLSEEVVSRTNATLKQFIFRL